MGTCGDGSDPADFLPGGCMDTTTTTLPIGPGYTGAPTGIVTSTDPLTGEPATGSMYSQLIAQGVAPADAYAYDPAGAMAAGYNPANLSLSTPGTQIKDSSGVVWNCDASGNCCDPNLNCQVGPPTTSDPTQAALAAKVAAISKATGAGYGAASAAAALAAASKAALTAAQITAGITAGSIHTAPVTTCPSGYQYTAGGCLPVGSGQWFSFATNNQVMTFGAVILAALVIVPALSGGGGGRRRR